MVVKISWNLLKCHDRFQIEIHLGRFHAFATGVGRFIHFELYVLTSRYVCYWFYDSIYFVIILDSIRLVFIMMNTIFVAPRLLLVITIVLFLSFLSVLLLHFLESFVIISYHFRFYVFFTCHVIFVIIVISYVLMELYFFILFFIFNQWNSTMNCDQFVHPFLQLKVISILWEARGDFGVHAWLHVVEAWESMCAILSK